MMNKAYSFQSGAAALGVALLLALVLTATPARAAIQEDAIFEVSLGGGLSVPSGDLSDYTFLDETLQTATGYQFYAAGGYFFTDLLSVGLGLSYTEYGMDAPALANSSGMKFRFYTASIYGKYPEGIPVRVFFTGNIISAMMRN